MAGISYGGPVSPDVFKTTTSYDSPGFSLPGGAGMQMPDLGGLLKRQQQKEAADKAARDRMRHMAEMRQIEMDQERKAPKPASRVGPQSEVNRSNRMDWSQSAPPMRYVTGPGIIPGPVMDVNAMNYQQRQMFLPQGASLQNEAPGLRQAAEAQELQNQIQRMRISGMRSRTDRAGGF